MSWTTAGGQTTMLHRRSTPSAAVVAASEEPSPAPVRATDQQDGDVLVPLAIWNTAPRVRVSCVHVLALPISQPSQNSSVLLNRWPSLSSFVQQYSNSGGNADDASGNASAATASATTSPTHAQRLQRLASAPSVVNLKRILKQRRSSIKRASCSNAATDDRAATAAMATAATPPTSSGSATSRDGIDLGDDCEFVDDSAMGEDDDAYQLCVFVGTVDGIIFYWLLEQDLVVQVNMLVHPGAGSPSTQCKRALSEHREPVQSLVSGIDEWGQSNLISITRDGAIAQWELPNGVCCRADVTLAKQLAPIKGMDMICNHRFAVVYGEQSRMMVLDTFKMVLLYCVDSAQEQVRRSIAICELRIPSRRSDFVQASFDSETPLRRVSEVEPESVTTSSFTMFIGGSAGTQQSAGSATLSPSASLGNIGSLSLSAGTSNVGSRSLNNLSSMQGSHPTWDSLVISLGTEGLVKCFLWSKPRGGVVASSSLNPGYQWMQQSCWVISWADETDDITCSQSTTLRNGDNMNPQTALMRSIKSTYFPRSIAVSADASLLLFVWDTRWAVLKRKWLCEISVQDSSGSKGKKKVKSSKYVCICKVAPRELLQQQSPSHDVGVPDNKIHWEEGVFTRDNQITMWTNTGHVFQFSRRGSMASSSAQGKLFIFTKDQDQLVPRSFHKGLDTVHHAQLVATMNTCQCCQASQNARKNGRWRSHRFAASDQQSFTSYIDSSAGGVMSTNVTSNASPRLVRVCPRGSVACWNVSQPEGHSPSRLARCYSPRSVIRSPIPYHTLSDGFLDLATSSNTELKSAQPMSSTLNHLMIGRDDSRSSCTCRLPSVCRQQRRARRQEDTSTGQFGANGVTSPSLQENAASPTHASRHGSFSASGGEVLSRYLLDIPVVVKGSLDGTVEFTLSGYQSSKSRELGVRLIQSKLHDGQVTAIGHCFWTTVSASTDVAATGKPTKSPSSSSSGSHSSSGRAYVSARRATTMKRGVPLEDSCLANDANPFYRWRFPPPVQRRRAANRNLNIRSSFDELASTSSFSASPKNVTSARNLVVHPAVHFMVFTGGADGIVNALELVLRSLDGVFSLELFELQQFKQCTNGVREIAFSPIIRESSSSPERFVATLGFNNAVNLYAPVYLHNPHSHGPSRLAQTRCSVEWSHVFELREHPDVVNAIDWHVESGVVNVECSDGMVYVWGLDTGVLERSIPVALLRDGGSNATSEEPDTCDGSTSPVECIKLRVGETMLHFFRCNVNKSAEAIKNNWRLYFSSISSATTSPRALPAISPYAIGSLELLFFSFLLSWGATPDIDRACRELLGLDAPSTLFSCVLMDHVSGAVTIPLPWKSIFPSLSGRGNELNPFSRKWQHSASMSANVALGIVSLSMNLIEHRYTFADSGVGVAASSSPRNKEEFHVLWSQLITQHSVVLPDYVPFFREPSLEYLARYGFHPCEYTQLAARALLNGAIKRLGPNDRSVLSAEYSAKLHCESARLETETGGKLNGTSSSNSIDASLVVLRLGSFVLLLSMIGTCFPGEISPASAREVCDILVYLLRTPAQHVASVASELMTKGLMLFRPHLVDLSSLVVQLLHIDLREVQRNPSADSPAFGGNARMLANGGNNAALSLLVELGACESAFVLNLLQQEMNNADRSFAFRECILKYLTELINTHYLLMFRHIPAIVDTIMCCLDPTKPERRKRCLELSTRCLHYLVRRFPMVDFHKDTQRLAVGTMEAVILIYDLRTATKWRVLDGHASSISALCFRSDGQILVSYAAREGSVRWWNSGNAGLFGGMLKMQQSCIKEHKLGALTAATSAPGSGGGGVGGTVGDLKQIIQTCRFQFLELKDAKSKQQPGGSVSGEAGERRVLRLTREDSSQVQFLM